MITGHLFVASAIARLLRAPPPRFLDPFSSARSDSRRPRFLSAGYFSHPTSRRLMSRLANHSAPYHCNSWCPFGTGRKRMSSRPTSVPTGSRASPKKTFVERLFDTSFGPGFAMNWSCAACPRGVGSITPPRERKCIAWSLPFRPHSRQDFRSPRYTVLYPRGKSLAATRILPPNDGCARTSKASSPLFK